MPLPEGVGRVYYQINEMSQMVFKSFIWPNNPHTCGYTCERTVIRHKYPELDGSELEDFDPDGAVITGSGEFFGQYAYEYWRQLLAVFKDKGPGSLFHPVYTDVTQAVFKRLESTMEPRPDYIAYTFEFWQHTPAVTSDGVSTTVSASTDSMIRVGSDGDAVVKIQNALLADDPGCLPNYGADGIFGAETEAAVRAYQDKHGLEVDGVVGPETLGHMGLSDVGSMGAVSGSRIVHTVSPGDTLSEICYQYGVDWHIIAENNNIADPHTIYVGQEIVISG